MKKFSELYENVYKHKPNLDVLLNEYKHARNKKIAWFVIIYLIIISIILLLDKSNEPNIFLKLCYNPWSLILSIFCLAFFMIVYYFSVQRLFETYRINYKRMVINDILKNIDENLVYSPNQGISLSEYHRGFQDRGERMISEDMIYGNLENDIYVKMSQVRVTHKEETRNTDGTTSTTTVLDYFGLCGFATLKTIARADFKITTNSKFRHFNKDRVELESYDFEKLYDVVATNRMYAIKILKPNIIEEFIKLSSSNCKKFEIKFKGQNVYFRYESGDIFEPPTRGNILNPEVINKFIMTIYNPLNIVKLLNDAIFEEQGAAQENEIKEFTRN